MPKGKREDQHVINIGDLSLWRKGPLSRTFHDGECKHLDLIYDDEGEIVTCRTCDRQISAFWALKRFQYEYSRYYDSLKARAKAVEVREKKGLRLKAAQEIEKAWRSRTMVPACPHCKKAIMPEDGFGGLRYHKEDTEAAEKQYRRVAKVFGLDQ